MRMNSSVTLLLALLGLFNSSKHEKELDLNFFQNDYQVKFERLELVRFNKKYMRDMKIVTSKFNRTQAVINATYTLNVNLSSDFSWVTQAYKFMSNEYRYFPLRFGARACNLMAANVAGCQKAMECGNFTGCPLLKGKTIHICNFFPDPSKLPPFIPSGDYKLEFQGVYLSEEVFVLDAYVDVFRPIVIN